MDPTSYGLTVLGIVSITALGVYLRVQWGGSSLKTGEKPRPEETQPEQPRTEKPRTTKKSRPAKTRKRKSRPTKNQRTEAGKDGGTPTNQ
jgi:hypothetical protein